MSIEDNKALIRSYLDRGLDVTDFLADDVVWVIPGLGTYNGKQDIQDRLLAPTDGLMESMGSVVITNMVGEGDFVVVEYYAQDRRTKTGRDYNNTYCQVFRIEDGLITQIHEYADTALSRRVFRG